MLASAGHRFGLDRRPLRRGRHRQHEDARQVAGGARASNTRIYTVGLDDASFKPGHAEGARSGRERRVRAGEGERSSHRSSTSSSQQISNEYLLQYKSLAGPDKPVRVKVQVNGVGTAADRLSDARRCRFTTRRPRRTSRRSGTASGARRITMILLALLGSRRHRAPRDRAAPAEAQRPARADGRVRLDPRASSATRAQPATAAATDGLRADETWWTRFEETLEIAEIKHGAGDARRRDVRASRRSTFLLIYLGTGSFWWALLRARRARTSSREWVIRTLARRRNRFAEQLPDALQVIASALRSGHSFAGALAVVVESASEPMKSEMQRVVADEQLGVPIQNSLEVVAERMASRDVEQLALVAELQREAGGDAAEVIDRVAETVRERFDLKRLIHTLTMQGRMSRWIVSALPIVIVLAVRAREPALLPPARRLDGREGRARVRRGVGGRRVVRHQEDRRDRGLRCCRDRLPPHRSSTPRERPSRSSRAA